MSGLDRPRGGQPDGGSGGGGPRGDEHRDSPLDPAIVAALRTLEDGSGEDGVLVDLVTMFIEDGRARVAKLHAAARSRDHVQVAELAHSLTGSSANFGARVVADLCRQLESHAAAGDLPAVSGLLAQLDRRYAEAEAALGAEFLGGARPPPP